MHCPATPLPVDINCCCCKTCKTMSQMYFSDLYRVLAMHPFHEDRRQLEGQNRCNDHHIHSICTKQATTGSKPVEEKEADLRLHPDTHTKIHQPPHTISLCQACTCCMSPNAADGAPFLATPLAVPFTAVPLEGSRYPSKCSRFICSLTCNGTSGSHSEVPWRMLSITRLEISPDDSNSLE